MGTTKNLDMTLQDSFYMQPKIAERSIGEKEDDSSLNEKKAPIKDNASPKKLLAFQHRSALSDNPYALK